MIYNIDLECRANRGLRISSIDPLPAKWPYSNFHSLKVVSLVGENDSSLFILWLDMLRILMSKH